MVFLFFSSAPTSCLTVSASIFLLVRRTLNDHFWVWFWALSSRLMSLTGMPSLPWTRAGVKLPGLLNNVCPRALARSNRSTFTENTRSVSLGSRWVTSPTEATTGAGGGSFGGASGSLGLEFHVRVAADLGGWVYE